MNVTILLLIWAIAGAAAQWIMCKDRADEGLSKPEPHRRLIMFAGGMLSLIYCICVVCRYESYTEEDLSVHRWWPVYTEEPDETEDED